MNFFRDYYQKSVHDALQVRYHRFYNIKYICLKYGTLTDDENKLVRKIMFRHDFLYHFPLTAYTCAAITYCFKQSINFWHFAAIFFCSTLVTTVFKSSVYREELLKNFPDGAYAEFLRMRQPITSYEKRRREAQQRIDLELREKQKKFLSYSELRKLNRLQYENRLQRQQDEADSPSTPSTPSTPIKPQQIKDFTVKRNKYGDIITDDW